MQHQGFFLRLLAICAPLCNLQAVAQFHGGSTSIFSPVHSLKFIQLNVFREFHPNSITLTWHNKLTTGFGAFADFIRSFSAEMCQLGTLVVQSVAVFLTTLRLQMTFLCTQYGQKCNRDCEKIVNHSPLTRHLCIKRFETIFNLVTTGFSVNSTCSVYLWPKKCVKQLRKLIWRRQSLMPVENQRRLGKNSEM